RLHTEQEFKSLYPWAINEIDAHGKTIGRDQIPWDWSLYFTATSCVLGDSIEIESHIDETTPPSSTVKQRQVIRVELRPGDGRRKNRWHDETTFSMFGTDRAIKNFQLDIYSITDPAEQERCTAWGCPSYTDEVDFRDETTDDCIVFNLFVKPETFAR